MPKLSREEKAAAQAVFRGEVQGKGPCEDCGGLHQRACPRVRRQVWLRTGAGDGQRTEVEYWPPGWDDTGVIWPEDAFDPAGDDEESADG
jgi:hypothetical protein